MEIFAFGLGVALLALVFWDVFQTIVVPRPTPGWFRLGRYLVRGGWRFVRIAAGDRMGPTRDRLFGLFALGRPRVVHRPPIRAVRTSEATRERLPNDLCHLEDHIEACRSGAWLDVTRRNVGPRLLDEMS